MAATHDIVLHDMAHGGEAVGRLADGRACFVRGGIPGETVRVELTQEKKKWARAQLVEVLEASEDRVEPPCPFVGDCGGCQWQHISLERQRVMKQAIVSGLLSHMGGIENPPVDEVVAVGEPDGFHYRNHVIFAVNEDGKIGYFRGGTREIVPVDRCLLLHPLLNEWHEALPDLPGAHRLELRAGTRTAQRMALFRGHVEAEALQTAYDRGVPLGRAGEGELTEMIGTDRLQVSSKSFFQVNTEGAEKLVELVMEQLEIGPEDSVVDAYAGVGLFSLPLSRVAEKVYSIERHPAAVRDLRHHAERSKGKIHVIATAVEEGFAQLPSHVSRVVADPPREGLGDSVIEELVALAPDRLVLVACDPASLARDVRGFEDRGYRLEKATPVDLFPQTFHVEIVATLVRAEA